MVVFIFAGDKAILPESWRKVFDEKNIVYLCPKNAGNKQDTDCRCDAPAGPQPMVLTILPSLSRMSDGSTVMVKPGSSDQA